MRWHWTATKDNQLHVENIPVFFDTEYNGLGIAMGIWPLSCYIKVGAKWMVLDERAKMGVLYHEAWHILAMHKWRRLAALLLPLPGRLQRISHAHEYDADKFAKSKGYGADFARALVRWPSGRRKEDRMFHPPLQSRVERLIDEAKVEDAQQLS